VVIRMFDSCQLLILCYCMCIIFYFFFFFQAEDGIRDFHVTGVQTCALPICLRRAGGVLRRLPRQRRAGEGARAGLATRPLLPERSEERRVGKECRSRGSPYH